MDEYQSPEPSRSRISRVSKACENCRTRRIRCERMNPPDPCRACQVAGLADCSVRSKARPGRSSKGAPDFGVLSQTTPAERIDWLRRIDRQLEQVYEQASGLSIKLELAEQSTHPSLDLATPLPPRPHLDASSSLAIKTFTTYGLPYCSFLTADRILDLYQRFADTPATLASDQTALVLSCLACGYLRLQAFGERGRAALFVPDDERQDVAWHRWAVDILDKVGSATFTSLHALSVMWWYSTMTCKSETARFFTSWMISQARELGINRPQTAQAIPFSPADRADLMFFQVIYAHYLSTGSSSLPPMYKAGEFDTVIIPAFQSSASESPAALVPRRAYLELTLMGMHVLLDLHDHTKSALSIDWLLKIEDRWAQWNQSWLRDGRTTGMEFADQFVGVLWDWGRIIVRAAILDDSRFAIISRYHDFYVSQHYNLVGQHIRHIVTSAHITLLCFARFELTKREAEQNLSTATWILHLCEPRWTEQVRVARGKIETIALAFGLNLFPVQAETNLQEAPDWLTSMAGDAAQTGLLFTDTTDFDPRAFDYLFENGT